MIASHGYKKGLGDAKRWDPSGISYLGFQSESIRTRREAPMRFNPTPPALELRRKMTGMNVSTSSNMTERVAYIASPERTY